MPQAPRPSPAPASLAGLSQVDFEAAFFDEFLGRIPDHCEGLRAQAKVLADQGRWAEGLIVDERLVALRPSDPVARYNLACRYARLRRTDEAIAALHKAIELGYRDFRYMLNDRDLEGIHRDPRFGQLLREHAVEPRR
jgi:tetratricopeptide (TPR) repeat protein